jgi:hypothetical protein
LFNTLVRKPDFSPLSNWKLTWLPHRLTTNQRSYNPLLRNTPPVAATGGVGL